MKESLRDMKDREGLSSQRKSQECEWCFRRREEKRMG